MANERAGSRYGASKASSSSGVKTPFSDPASISLMKLRVRETRGPIQGSTIGTWYASRQLFKSDRALGFGQGWLMFIGTKASTRSGNIRHIRKPA